MKLAHIISGRHFMYGIRQLALIVDTQLVIGAADAKLWRIGMMGNAKEANATFVANMTQHYCCRVAPQIKMFDLRILAGTHDLMTALWHHNHLVHRIVMTIKAHWFKAAATGRRNDGTSHLAIPTGGHNIQTAGAVNKFRLEYVKGVTRFEAVAWLAICPVPYNDGEIIRSGAN